MQRQSLPAQQCCGKVTRCKLVVCKSRARLTYQGLLCIVCCSSGHCGGQRHHCSGWCLWATRGCLVQGCRRAGPQGAPAPHLPGSKQRCTRGSGTGGTQGCAASLLCMQPVAVRGQHKRPGVCLCEPAPGISGSQILCWVFVGFQQQVRDVLKVEWIEGDPARGIDYVYLADEDHQKVAGSVKATLRVQPDGERCCSCRPAGDEVLGLCTQMSCGMCCAAKPHLLADRPRACAVILLVCRRAPLGCDRHHWRRGRPGRGEPEWQCCYRHAVLQVSQRLVH